MKLFKQIDCFSRNLNFFKYLGIYPLDLTWPFYKFFSKAFIFVFIILYIFLCTLNFFFIPICLEDFIDELTFYFTEVSAMSKILTFVLQKDKIKDILDTLESDLFQPKLPEGFKLIDEAKKFNILYWKIVAGVSVTANIAHLLSPLIRHFIFNIDLVFPVSSYSFLPYNVIEAYRYPIFAYQGAGIHVMMLYNINIDTFFLGLMTLLIAQLKVLRKILTDVTKEIKKEEKCESIPQGIEIDVIMKLNKALVHYAKVTEFCRLIENVFSVTLFVQFSVASCIICICLFKFTLPAPWQYYIFLSTYMFVMVVQILVPSWFGTQVIEESNILSEAIYNCDWTPRSKQFKSSMRLFVERAKRPLSITGWKMFPLSLVTFTSIMKSAYSFFTLLQNVQSTS